MLKRLTLLAPPLYKLWKLISEGVNNRPVISTCDSTVAGLSEDPLRGLKVAGLQPGGDAPHRLRSKRTGAEAGAFSATDSIGSKTSSPCLSGSEWNLRRVYRLCAPYPNFCLVLRSMHWYLEYILWQFLLDMHAGLPYLLCTNDGGRSSTSLFFRRASSLDEPLL